MLAVYSITPWRRKPVTMILSSRTGSQFVVNFPQRLSHFQKFRTFCVKDFSMMLRNEVFKYPWKFGVYMPSDFNQRPIDC